MNNADANFSDTNLFRANAAQFYSATAYAGVKETQTSRTEITTSTQKITRDNVQTQQIPSIIEEKLSVPVIPKDGIQIVQDLKLIKVSLKSPHSSSEASEDTSSEVTVKISQGVNIPDVDVEHDIMLKKYEHAEVSQNILRPALSKGFSTHTEEASADIKVAESEEEGITHGMGLSACLSTRLCLTGFSRTQFQIPSCFILLSLIRIIDLLGLIFLTLSVMLVPTSVLYCFSCDNLWCYLFSFVSILSS